MEEEWGRAWRLLPAGTLRETVWNRCSRETVGTVLGSHPFHCDSGATVSMETHHTSTSLSRVPHLVLSAELNRLFVLPNTAENETLRNRHETVTGALGSPTVLIWKPGWDSLRGAPLKFSPLGLFRLPPGRCAPFSWVTRPLDSAAPTTTSATLREPWTTHPLIHQACSRGPIGGKCVCGMCAACLMVWLVSGCSSINSSSSPEPKTLSAVLLWGVVLNSCWHFAKVMLGIPAAAWAVDRHWCLCSLANDNVGLVCRKRGPHLDQLHVDQRQKA